MTWPVDHGLSVCGTRRPVEVKGSQLVAFWNSGRNGVTLNLIE